METNETKRSLCVFCLKSTNDFDYSNKNDQYKFFTLIFRHFTSYSALISADEQGWCRNACKVISEITICGDDNEAFFENVKTCGNCELTTRKFSELYHQMKELELRLDWEIDKLWDVMGYADKAVSQLEKNQLEKASTNGGVVTLGEFRNTLKESCKAYLAIKKKKTVPNVQLKQIIEDKESPLKEKRDDVDFQVGKEESSTTALNTQEYVTQNEVHEYLSQPEVDIQRGIFTKDQNVQDEDPLNPLTLNDSQSNYICSTFSCSLPFTSKFELFKHNMANHIGKYFLSVQSSSLSSDQFNYCVTHLLEATLDTFENEDEKNYKCPFCSNLFPGQEKARNHLVVKHRPILKEELVETQKLERFSLNTIETKIIPSTTDTLCTTLKRKRGWPKGKSRKFHFQRKKSPPNLYCSHCSRMFPNEHVIFQHDMSKHPEKYFASVKLETLTPHQFHNCVANMLRGAVDQLKITDSKYQCNYCIKLLSGKQSAKSHLVRKHISLLKEKLVELQNSSNIDILHTNRKLNMDRCLIRKEHGHICSICEKAFTQSFLVRQHQRHCHPEIFFESSNLFPSLSSSPENNEQFKTYVRYVLEKQRGSQFSKEGVQIKCCLCSKGLKSSVDVAKSHLISIHRSFLAEKLEELQKSGKRLGEIEEELVKMKGTKVFEKIAPARSEIVGATSTASQLTVDCSFCSISFKNKFSLFQHFMHNHLDKYFISAKLQSISNDHFKKIIVHLLNKTVEESKKSKSRYACPFCPTLFCGRQATKNHLVKKHRPILKEKLVELQNCGDVVITHPNSKAKPHLRISKNNYSVPNCHICGKVFKASFMLNSHQSIYHPEIFFENGRPTELQQLDSEGNDLFSKYVKQVLQKQVDQNFSKVTVTLDEPQASVPLPQQTSKVDNIKYQCSFCSKALYSRRIAITHLVLRHQQEMEQVLGDLKGKPVEEIKLEVGQGHINLGTGNPDNVGKRCPGQTFECSLCSTHFKNNFCLFQHNMSRHIEKYFSCVKLEFISDEQFKKCIVQTLEKCVGDFEKVNSKYKCSFCAMQLCGSKTSRYHLIAKHLGIVKDKLVEAQKSGSDLEQVESGILSANGITLKLKRGWPKGKSRIVKMKRRGRRRAKRVIDHVPVFRRQRVSKLSKCGGCGNRFVSVHTLRTHLKGYCKVLRENESSEDLRENSGKIEERMEVSKNVK